MISIIDLTFTTPEVGALNMWVNDKGLMTLCNHEVIQCDLADSEGEIGSMGTSHEVIR